MGVPGRAQPGRRRPGRLQHPTVSSPPPEGPVQGRSHRRRSQPDGPLHHLATRRALGGNGRSGRRRTVPSHRRPHIRRDPPHTHPRSHRCRDPRLVRPQPHRHHQRAGRRCRRRRPPGGGSALVRHPGPARRRPVANPTGRRIPPRDGPPLLAMGAPGGDRPRRRRVGLSRHRPHSPVRPVDHRLWSAPRSEGPPLRGSAGVCRCGEMAGAPARPDRSAATAHHRRAGGGGRGHGHQRAPPPGWHPPPSPRPRRPSSDHPPSQGQWPEPPVSPAT